MCEGMLIQASAKTRRIVTVGCSKIPKRCLVMINRVSVKNTLRAFETTRCARDYGLVLIGTLVTALGATVALAFFTSPIAPHFDKGETVALVLGFTIGPVILARSIYVTKKLTQELHDEAFLTVHKLPRFPSWYLLMRLIGLSARTLG